MPKYPFSSSGVLFVLIPISPLTLRNGHSHSYHTILISGYFHKYSILHLISSLVSIYPSSSYIPIYITGTCNLKVSQEIVCICHFCFCLCIFSDTMIVSQESICICHLCICHLSASVPLLFNHESVSVSVTSVSVISLLLHPLFNHESVSVSASVSVISLFLFCLTTRVCLFLLLFLLCFYSVSASVSDF